MADPIAVLALTVSIASAIFVALKMGLGLTLDYRESELTAKRKKEIDKNLLDELRERIKDFSEKDMKNKIDEELLDSIERLGYLSILSRTTTEQLLDKMSSQVGLAFRLLFLGLYTLSFTVFFVLVGDLSSIQNLFVLAFFLIPTLVFIYWTASCFKKFYLLRKSFVDLYEKPNLDYCEELIEQLQDENLW